MKNNTFRPALNTDEVAAPPDPSFKVESGETRTGERSDDKLSGTLISNNPTPKY